MIPRKPYLLNALCDWAEDNGWTPMIVVQADRPNVQVPQNRVIEGKITLNISQRATNERDISVDGLHALARFSGEIQRLLVPLDAIEAFIVRETGEGMVFPEEPDADGGAEEQELGSDSEVDEPKPPEGAPAGSQRGHLKVIK